MQGTKVLSERSFVYFVRSERWEELNSSSWYLPNSHFPFCQPQMQHKFAKILIFVLNSGSESSNILSLRLGESKEQYTFNFISIVTYFCLDSFGGGLLLASFSRITWALQIYVVICRCSLTAFPVTNIVFLWTGLLYPWATNLHLTVAGHQVLVVFCFGSDSQHMK